jgi:hypothetical protein
MLFNLPNGKTIYLTVDEYLALTDEDFQDLVASGYGEAPSNPFYGSVIRKPGRAESNTDSIEDYYERDGLDFEVEDDETSTAGPFDINNIPDEDTLE